MRRIFSLYIAVSLLFNVHVLHSSSDLLHVLLTFRQVVDGQDQARFGRKLDHPLPISFGSLNYCQESGLSDVGVGLAHSLCVWQQRKLWVRCQPFQCLRVTCTVRPDSYGTMDCTLELIYST